MFHFFRNRRLYAITFLLMVIGQSVAIAQVAWVRNFDDAVKLAAREKKSIILDVSASW